MVWWVYKCNSRNRPYQHHFGDWREFFNDRAAGSKVTGWGLVSYVTALGELHPGDMVLAYQTDRNELVGVVQFVKHLEGEVYFKVLEEIGAKVRPLKQADPAIAAIPALRPGPIWTLYEITEVDALRLLKAARAKAMDSV